MEKFKVEQDQPGVIVTFNITPSDVHDIWNDGGIVEINYKEMFKTLTGRKRNASSSSKNNTSAATTSQPSLPSSSALGPATLAPSNRFELMISQLERKYLDLANYQGFSDHEGSLTSNSTCTSPGDVPISPEQGKGKSSSTTSTNKKKKKRIIEDYDYSDNFIDDTEAVEELEEAMRMKKMKTVHDGFFVSSGHLDVVQAPPPPKKNANTSSTTTKDSQAKSSSNKKSETDSAGQKATGSSKSDKPDDKEKDKEKRSKDKDKEKDSAAKKEKVKKSDKDKDDKEKEKDKGDKEKEKDIEKEKEKKTKKVKTPNQTEPESSTLPPAVTLASTTINEQPTVPGASSSSATIPESQGSAPMDITDEIPQQTAENADVTGSTDNTTKKVKVPVEKPDWQPCEEVKVAMESFKVIIEQSGVAASKRNSKFPQEWEKPLLSLDKLVLTHHPSKEINRTKGYYEFIESVFGSHFTTGRIKTIIARLGLAEEANATKELLDGAVVNVFEELKLAIIPCPDNKQPGNKPPRKSLKGAADAEDGVDGGAETVDLTSPTKGDSTIGENANSAAVQLSLEPLTPGKVTNDSVTPQQTSAANETIGGLIDIANATNITVEEAKETAAIKYEWYCKWSIPLRQALVAIEDLTEAWVKAENKYREKLTAADRKDMIESDFQPIDLRDERNRIFADIIKVFPASCLQGDMTSIRKNISTERSRQRKAAAPKVEPSANSKSESSGSAINKSKAPKGEPAPVNIEE